MVQLSYPYITIENDPHQKNKKNLKKKNEKNYWTYECRAVGLGTIIFMVKLSGNLKNVFKDI